MKLNKINHIGIVVEDADEACERYGKIYGIDKWYELDINDLDLWYKDKKRDCEIKLYFGGKGLTKIELIETHGQDNAYTSFLKRQGEGMHHVMYNVRNLEKAILSLEQDGMMVIQHATFKSAGANVRFAYMGWKEEGVVIELVETEILPGIIKGDLPGEFGLGKVSGSYRRVR